MRKTAIVFFLAVALACSKGGDNAKSPGPSSAPLNTENQARLLSEILKEDPKNLDAWIKLGNIYMDSGRFPGAIDAYRKALELDPKNVNVRVDMGTCYRYSGRPDRAVEEYRKALKHDPNHLYGHKNLGIVLAFDLGDRAGGIRELETYLKLAPPGPEASEVRKEIERLKTAPPK